LQSHILTIYYIIITKCFYFPLNKTNDSTLLYKFPENMYLNYREDFTWLGVTNGSYVH